jgi:uncharacterized protein (DUF302 family)
MNGLIIVSSEFSVKETIDRIDSIVRAKGSIVFARIDHAANAAQAGLQLRPTELLIFGNPKAGTLLIQDQQTAGIDLPLKILAWEDESGKVWIAYNDLNWLAERHHLLDASTTRVEAIASELILLSASATKNQQ